ncbi:hypothetical protein BT69DRAFT_1293423 [Atractiella rhizophila]|nr:hypothetical protein BT69DRAFT_1293423 [Atractiella rhizophila]
MSHGEGMQRGMQGGWDRWEAYCRCFQLLVYFAIFIHLRSFEWRLICQQSGGANSQGDNGALASRFLIFRGALKIQSTAGSHEEAQQEATRKQAAKATLKDLLRMTSRSLLLPWKGVQIEGAEGGRGGVKAESGKRKAQT